jgi:hypothetical protein
MGSTSEKNITTTITEAVNAAVPEAVSAAVTVAVNAAFQQCSIKIFEKLETLLSKVDQLEKRQDHVEEYVNNMTNSITSEFAAVRAEIQEEKQRIIRMSNLVLMGVPESAEGLVLAKELMQLLHPTWGGQILDRRIGQPNPSNPNPRPLRVPLQSAAVRDLFLGSCHLLKNNQKFSKISVRKDLTKAQQKVWQDNAPVRRSGRGKNKRDGEDGGVDDHGAKGSKVARKDNNIEMGDSS